MPKFILMSLMLLFFLIPSLDAHANIYPSTMDDGNLVMVSGRMGVGVYADKSSVHVEKYAPPDYEISIDTVSISFNDGYYKRHQTYIGSPYKIGKPMKMSFRYNWNNKTMSYFRADLNKWCEWDIKVPHSTAEGEPLIPNTAETAFVTAYKMKFYGDTVGYKNYKVIGDYLYKELGI